MDPFDEIVIKNYLSFPLVLQKLLSIKKLRRIEFLAKIWQRILCLMS